MAMLAERRRKTKFVLNPISKQLWLTESSGLQFGKKLMEKMGWSTDKGLGANEQGIKEPVRALYKQDSTGIGFKGDGNPFHNQDEFDALLKSIAGVGDTANEASEQAHTFESLEEKSRNCKTRVHYKKFTRGKDISRYSKLDLASIVGTGKKPEEPEEPIVVKQEEGTKGDMENAFGVTTIHGGSIADYFKSRFAKVKTESIKVEDDNNEEKPAFGTETYQAVAMTYGNMSESNDEQPKKKKRKRDRDAKEEIEEVKTENIKVEDEKSLSFDTAHSQVVAMTCESLSEKTGELPKKKKRKKDRDAKEMTEARELECNKNGLMNSSTQGSEESNSPEDQSIKKKRKHKKEVGENSTPSNGHDFEELKKDLDLLEPVIEENNEEVPKKKKKKKRSLGECHGEEIGNSDIMDKKLKKKEKSDKKSDDAADLEDNVPTSTDKKGRTAEEEISTEENSADLSCKKRKKKQRYLDDCEPFPTEETPQDTPDEAENGKAKKRRSKVVVETFGETEVKAKKKKRKSKHKDEPENEELVDEIQFKKEKKHKKNMLDIDVVANSECDISEHRKKKRKHESDEMLPICEGSGVLTKVKKKKSKRDDDTEEIRECDISEKKHESDEMLAISISGEKKVKKKKSKKDVDVEETNEKSSNKKVADDVALEDRLEQTKNEEKSSENAGVDSNKGEKYRWKRRNLAEDLELQKDLAEVGNKFPGSNLDRLTGYGIVR